MSPTEEYQDLEERLRQTRPRAEAMPPALKNRLRNQLLQQASEKQPRFNFSPLRVAFGALALLMIPLLYWVWQSSLHNGGALSAVTRPDTVEPALVYTITPTPEDESAVTAEPPADWVEIRSSFPTPGMPLGMGRDTLWVMVAHELSSAEEAQLRMQLAVAAGPDAGRIVATSSAQVGRGPGTTTLSLSLAGEAVPEEGVSLRLSAELQAVNGESGQSYATAGSDEHSWPLMGQGDASLGRIPSALVMGNGVPEPYEDGMLAPGASNYQVEVVVAYDLGGAYDEGMVTLAYSLETDSGSSSGATSSHVESGSGTITFPLLLEADFFISEGKLRPGVEMWIELMGYDPASSEYVSLYPFEASQAPPTLQERLEIQSVNLGEDDSGNPTLLITIWYERKTGQESAVLLTLEDGSPAPIASVTHPIRKLRDNVSVALPVDLNAYTADMLLRVAVTMEGEANTLMDELPLLVGSLTGDRVDEVWLVSIASRVDEVRGTAQQEVILGYNLSEAHAAGMITHDWEQRTPSTGGGGGGGGGMPIEPGTGTLRLMVPFGRVIESADGARWPDGLHLRVALMGQSGDGSFSDELFVLELP